MAISNYVLITYKIKYIDHLIDIMKPKEEMTDDFYRHPHLPGNLLSVSEAN